MKVVFVHLGPAKAAHLKKNIEHISRNFPQFQITLITSIEAHKSLLQIKNINHFQYEPTMVVSELINSLGHNPKFRKGFWFYSLERIYALRDWSLKTPNESFLHIESDILLMKDFPSGKIFEGKSLAWTRHSENADVATFLYSPNFSEIDWMTVQISQLIKNDSTSTDMSVLSNIAKKYKDRVLILPSRIEHGENNENNQDLIGFFGGIFDPAAYGMWLTGQDPRNNLGVIRKFISLPGAEVNPADFRFRSWPLGTLKIVDSSVCIPVFNLHLHNKRLLLFGRFWTIFLALDILYSHKRICKYSISPRAIWSVLSDINSRYGLFTIKAFKVFIRQVRSLRSK